MRSFYKIRTGILAGIWLIFYFSLVFHFSGYSIEDIEKITECILHNGTNAATDVKYFDLLTTVPRYDRGIFFIDATCSNTGIVELKPRYACSIESAARLHPHRDVIVLFSSAVGLPFLQPRWSSTIKVLKGYPNIYFRNVQFDNLTAGTPLEGWAKTSNLFRSQFLYAHVSDIIRVLLLYKFGGTYLDLDQMVLKNLNFTQRNFVVLEPDGRMANSILDFERNGKILHQILTEIKQNYNPDEYFANGGPIIARFMRELCKEDDLTKMKREVCHGIDVFDAKRFSPLSAEESHQFFKKKYAKDVLNKLEEAITFHYYNSHTTGINITMGKGDAYDFIARKYCPRIYGAHQDEPF